jgi:chemotaxis protein MotA
MSTELDYLAERHKTGAAVFEAMAMYAPAFGMIGTLVGLIAMLASMDNPSTIGPSMGVALITTLYGALIANLICSPIAGKLKNRSASELLLKQLCIEGIMAIQSGDNPRIVEGKLKAFLAPSQRSLLAAKKKEA